MSKYAYVAQTATDTDLGQTLAQYNCSFEELPTTPEQCQLDMMELGYEPDQFRVVRVTKTMVEKALTNWDPSY